MKKPFKNIKTFKNNIKYRKFSEIIQNSSESMVYAIKMLLEHNLKRGIA